MSAVIPLAAIDSPRTPPVDTGADPAESVAPYPHAGRGAAHGTRPQDDVIAGYLAVLGQPHRLRIFRLLLEGELCVCDLEEQMTLSRSLLAHHLRKLRESGLIQVRRGFHDARWLYYSINPPMFALLQSLLSDLTGRRELPAQALCGSNCNCG